MGARPVLCPLPDQCHAPGACDPATGVCSNPPKPDGATCDDGLRCTTNDVCTAGACAGTPVICAPSDQCHAAGTCDPATGACSNPVKPDGLVCDDGDVCTETDTCQAGACVGSNAITCQAGACHSAGSCDSGAGLRRQRTRARRDALQRQLRLHAE